ncbi:PQQ-dependent sugar dehydrogenase [Brevundimonas sp.]|uniref:PQQ-dependent sugar dehydrogenase n=1 Tax=Brevundimonas sp. TaxID=1871086 RepID=UPI002D75EB0F|nr:PQQ-dependent sugar dehydrogenase [Brevundimonas sp.]HYC75480.1 PQQ-dependent sugar dehydrogenase [Brevundimonas sp.]
MARVVDEEPLAAVIGGTGGNDTLTGTPDADTVDGGAGADVLSGGGGADIIQGGDGNDLIYGFSEADTEPGAGLITATRIVSGLSNPLFAASPPGDPDRLFIVEQNTGRIRILDLTDNTLAATPFLDIPQEQLSTGGERGLLGLAFHPDFATNGRFYVNLTNAAGDTEIWEYTRTGTDFTDPASRTLVLSYDQPFSNHNGGWMAFGPDGLLYIASGDGGSAGDPNNNAQNIDSLLGKVLRIDVDRDDFPGDPARNYGIPPGNPFVGQAGADEVFILGLRNPWRMSFDVNGDLYIADVGQNAREELNVIPAGTGAGRNLGWRIFEGDLPFNGTDPGGLTDPVLSYSHGSGPMQGRSITGGYVYHGPEGGDGLYFFADFVSGNLWTTRIVDGVAVDFARRNGQLAIDAGTVNQMASFAQDGRGRLYVIGLDGEIHRLTPSETAGDVADVLNGGAGDDTIHGGVGEDLIGGDDGDDGLFGGLGDDVLVGAAGNDALNGAGGNDAADYSAAPAAVRVRLDLAQANDGQGGTDTLAAIETVIGSSFDDTLFGDAGANTLIGGAGRDVLLGLDGADILTGGAGVANQLQGGAGNDRYRVEANDTIVELAGGGIDTVETATRSSFTLPAHVEVLIYTGTGGFVGQGNNVANTIRGGTGRDTLIGLGGNDALEGGAGAANTLYGGPGDDRYVLQARDTIIEYAGEGTDTVQTALTRITLPAHVENLTFTGSSEFIGAGNGLNNILTGGTARDSMAGMGGDDVLIGGSGAANQLQGGTGDDRYVVSAADTIVELAGEGTDTVETSLAVHTLAANVEHLTFTGAGGFRGVGNASANTLTGGAGADVLAGRGGDDILNGGGGSDIVELLGLMADYQITDLGGGSWRVIDMTAGRDGSDVLNGVEQIRFGNGQVLALGGPAPAPALIIEEVDWTAGPWERDAPF